MKQLIISVIIFFGIFSSVFAADTAPMPAPSATEAPEIAPTSEASPSINPTEIGLTPEPATTENATPPAAAAVSTKKWEYGSLMYNEKSVDWINQAIKSHDEGIPLDILLPTIFAPTTSTAKPLESIEQNPMIEMVAEAPTDKPNFYLKSILYFAPDNWTIWINDKKIVYGETYGELTFAKVAKEELVVLWKGVKMDKVSPDWKRVLLSLDNKRFSNSQNIVFDQNSGDVAFVLKPNQTLVSEQMQIIEGTHYKTVTATPDPTQTMGMEGDMTGTPKEKAKSEIINSEVLGNEMQSKNMKNYLNQINNLQAILGAVVPADNTNIAPVAE